MEDVDLTDSTMLSILQICDTAFPTGGFSHSMGFESAHKHNFVTNQDSFRRFILSCLENIATKMIPFVKEAHRAVPEVEAVVRLDRKCQSCLTNHVENRASRRQGRAFLETSTETFSSTINLYEFSDYIDKGRLLGHLPIVFGAVLSLLQVNERTTKVMFMYNALKTITSSAVRLGYIGTLQAQRVQNEIQSLIPKILDRHKDLTTDEAHVSFPSADILQNLHDTLFAKLFYS